MAIVKPDTEGCPERSDVASPPGVLMLEQLRPEDLGVGPQCAGLFAHGDTCPRTVGATSTGSRMEVAARWMAATSSGRLPAVGRVPDSDAIVPDHSQVLAPARGHEFPANVPTSVDRPRTATAYFFFSAASFVRKKPHACACCLRSSWPAASVEYGVRSIRSAAPPGTAL
jgi:hypothetical protein